MQKHHVKNAAAPRFLVLCSSFVVPVLRSPPGVGESLFVRILRANHGTGVTAFAVCFIVIANTSSTRAEALTPEEKAFAINTDGHRFPRICTDETKDKGQRRRRNDLLHLFWKPGTEQRISCGAGSGCGIEKSNFTAQVAEPDLLCACFEVKGSLRGHFSLAISWREDLDTDLRRNLKGNLAFHPGEALVGIPSHISRSNSIKGGDGTFGKGQPAETLQ